MPNGQQNDGTRSYTLSEEVFHQAGLDIHSQMVYIILKCFATESHFPNVAEIAKLGRMDEKQTVKALQRLVELKILPLKLFRRMVGVFQDDRLSWSAKGLLLFCKEHPRVELHSLLEMASQSGEDEENIRRSLQELSLYGYLDEFPEWRQIAN
ncbi:hypothetical protein I8J29_21705 [Paenibacillus sp. MWE-103]|uniref:Helix-turn-helix protein n=1 Tax=Paenibacillus artemisiicola TaxID=1172618 RepID=A0ABS3WET6_9BACL|nr:hypothetical protein [Paenibacillus artemisiicola]MBO7746836.1 hypothetical protein [Paenibacillus artemisiicola]